jgi:hypothetical protein
MHRKQLPDLPKQQEIFGLTPATEYFIAIKTMDLWGNKSGISNVVSATTDDAPVISVNPEKCCNLYWILVVVDSSYIRVYNTGRRYTRIS